MANALWVTERANPFFVLQRRRGHGKGGGLTGERRAAAGPMDAAAGRAGRARRRRGPGRGGGARGGRGVGEAKRVSGAGGGDGARGRGARGEDGPRTGERQRGWRWEAGRRLQPTPGGQAKAGSGLWPIAVPVSFPGLSPGVCSLLE